MTRKALLVGIDHYHDSQINNLRGCSNDAVSVAKVLERNGDGRINFNTKTLISRHADDTVTSAMIEDALKELFAGDDEVALFYFAGHGFATSLSGQICAPDQVSGRDGILMSKVIQFAHESRARNKILIFDCCSAGAVAQGANTTNSSEIAEGMTILAACEDGRNAEEEDGNGVFTTLLIDALQGSACNLVGHITPGAVYAHIDQSLGPWRQRPVFKTNINRFVSLKEVEPPIPLEDLAQLPVLFPKPGFHFKLDPSFEPERSGSEPPGTPEPDLRNTARFKVLQKYNRVNLLVPLESEHMWHAAMQSEAVCLTALGEHYRKLVEDDLI